MTAVVIVGSSVAGVRTAQSLRSNGYEGEVILIGEEDELPYDKPPLSKELLGGAVNDDEIRLLTEEAAERLGITLRLGFRAVGLDVAEKTVHLENGEAIHYDKLVVATGAHARPSPWNAKSGVHVLRTLADSRALRTDLLEGGPLVIVGAGFIGAEIASTARKLGLPVTMVDPQPIPMSRVFNSEIGEWFTDLHHRHGVHSVFGVGVEQIEGVAGDLRISLTTGQVLEASTVVVGIGAIPNDAWLQDSGLLIDDGLVCDQYCRVIENKDLYAVGDVARWWCPTLGLDVRAEHWTNAIDQAQCVAHNIIHPSDQRPFAPVPYVWSDQYDWKIQVVGRTGGDLAHNVVGDASSEKKSAALYSDKSGLLVGAATVNWPRALVECRRELARGNGIEVTDVQSRLESLLR